MKTMMAAVALAIAFPAAAHAQPPAPTTTDEHEHDGMDCCCKGEKKMPCCEKMRGKHKGGEADPHAGHDMGADGDHQQPQN